jgi:hypothetical protein
MACERFKAKVVPHFDADKLDVLPIHAGDRDKIVVGYTHFSDTASAFIRFIVDDAGGRAIINAPFVRCMADGLKFKPIVADDEGQALDKLADWFIANKDAITQPRASWQAY